LWASAGYADVQLISGALSGVHRHPVGDVGLIERLMSQHNKNVLTFQQMESLKHKEYGFPRFGFRRSNEMLCCNSRRQSPGTKFDRTSEEDTVVTNITPPPGYPDPREVANIFAKPIALCLTLKLSYLR